MASGDKSGLRPDSPAPWIPEEVVNDVLITLSEDPEEPTYLDTVTVTKLDNVEEVQIRVVRIFDGPEELVLTDNVSIFYLCHYDHSSKIQSLCCKTIRQELQKHAFTCCCKLLGFLTLAHAFVGKLI